MAIDGYSRGFSESRFQTRGPVYEVRLTSLVVIPSVTRGRGRMQKVVTPSPTRGMYSETDGHVDWL